MAQALEDMGIAGKSFLQEALTNTTDPLGAIEEFQQENSILLPSLQPALPLLDLHDLKRLDFHQSVFEVLRDHLLNRITEISKEKDSAEKLNAILEKSFPVIKIDSLVPVSMCLLKHLPKVPEKYISVLTKDKSLYSACPIQVKRQIWQKNQTIFGDEVLPLLTRYIKEKEVVLLDGECLEGNNFFTSSPKSRRQGHVVKTLTEMIGKNIRLYDMVLQFLRTLFLKTHNVHYCSLRSEMLMSLHDLEVTEVCTVDPCYKFTWCLDACIREHYVDVKRARELQGFLDNVRKGHEQVLGDLSMILCDPFAVNTMLWSVMKIIHELTIKETLPRESTELMLLIRMLKLGQSAWDIINKQIFKEPKVDVDISNKFIPCMVCIGVSEQSVLLRNKVKNLRKIVADCDVTTPDDEQSKKKSKPKKAADIGDESNDKETSSTAINYIHKHIEKDQLCRIILMWFTLHLVKNKRKTQLIQVLPILGKECSMDNVFLHALTTSFTSHPELVADDNLCQALFNKLLVVTKSLKETQHRQILRLVINVCHKLPAERLKILISKLEPKGKKAAEVLIQLHQKLKTKVSSLQSSATPSEPADPTSASNILGVATIIKPH
ncbi:negative elongation factor B [Ciona intestinalis]